jgi:hypothetical protein
MMLLASHVSATIATHSFRRMKAIEVLRTL